MGSLSALGPITAIFFADFLLAEQCFYFAVMSLIQAPYSMPVSGVHHCLLLTSEYLPMVH